MTRGDKRPDVRRPGPPGGGGVRTAASTGAGPAVRAVAHREKHSAPAYIGARGIVRTRSTNPPPDVGRSQGEKR